MIHEWRTEFPEVDSVDSESPTPGPTRPFTGTSTGGVENPGKFKTEDGEVR